jgi:hypothetical protein
MSWRTPPSWQRHELAEERPSRGRVESVGGVHGSALYVPIIAADRRDDVGFARASAQEVRAARVDHAGAAIAGGRVLREA